MNLKYILPVLILSLVIGLEFMALSRGVTAPIIEIDTPVPINEVITQVQILIAPTADPIPNFQTVLWNYDGQCSYNGIRGSCTPQKYITPKNNEVIQWYANRIDIVDGKLMWNETTHPIGLYGIVGFNFSPDDKQFGKDDLWQNPDYFLTHGMVGDCEDSALAVASILEAKGVRAIVVGGYLSENGNRYIDWIVEYKYGGEYYRFIGGVNNNIFIQREQLEKQKWVVGMDFEPRVAFDKDNYYHEYRADW